MRPTYGRNSSEVDPGFGGVRIMKSTTTTTDPRAETATLPLPADDDDQRLSVPVHTFIGVKALQNLAATTVVRARAWWWIHARTAVVLDTETTGLQGQICELSIIDAKTGMVLFDSLIRPTCPMEEQAAAVHGITEADLVTAPTLEQVWPRIRWALGDGLITAYNASFDRLAFERSARAAGIAHDQLTEPRRWRCIMRARAHAERRRWQRLDAGHRALGDTHAARQVLLDLAAGRDTTATPAGSTSGQKWSMWSKGDRKHV